MEANDSLGHFIICVISFRIKMSFTQAKLRKEMASFKLAKRALKLFFNCSSRLSLGESG